MKVNLALNIFEYIVRCSSAYNGAPISMKLFREDLKIPKGTFYRHMNTLIEIGWVVRTKRDNYAVSAKFKTMMLRINREQFQLDMFASVQ